ncbi:MAG: DUF2490 domain-containing protein [Candidatus Omnitrophota bacterium]|nr:DUF2490 domain-containing protein [Candidatus Omnitrophota bacterium]
MKKQIVLIMALLLFVTAVAYAYDDGDFQVWNTDVEEMKINDKSKIAFEQEFRWGDNADEFFYQHYDIGFFYNLQKYLNVGAGYRYIYESKKRRFRLERSPYVTLSLLWDSKGFKFEDRSRLEYRSFQYQADAWRYRNKISMKFPWKYTKMEIQPYMSDEMLFSLSATNQLNQNRASAGIGMNLTKNIKGEIYYMLQTMKSSGKWIDANVVGTKFKISF